MAWAPPFAVSGTGRAWGLPPLLQPWHVQQTWLLMSAVGCWPWLQTCCWGPVLLLVTCWMAWQQERGRSLVLAGAWLVQQQALQRASCLQQGRQPVYVQHGNQMQDWLPTACVLPGEAGIKGKHSYQV